ncbi:MAG: ABC transporter permease [Clostridiales bacterium]|nr:ABC transporter permease [Clostridiales bacterium]
MSLMLLQGSLELGMIYAIMALGVFISFRTLNMPDLTVDGSFTLGAAFSAILVSTGGNPFLGLLLAFVAGCCAGCITALLHTKLKIQPLLAGILTMLALYSINLKVMFGKANIPLLNKITIFSGFEGSKLEDYGATIIAFVVLTAVFIILFLFLKTRLGFALRATGDNDNMVRAMGINTDFTIMTGLAISNGMVALSGAIIAQYQSFADISMGTGMVVIGLASVIIGEVIFGTKPLLRRLLAVILGAILYRLVIAYVMDRGMPPTDLKLISAVIVALALSMTTIRERFRQIRKRMNAGKGGIG